MYIYLTYLFTNFRKCLRIYALPICILFQPKLILISLMTTMMVCCCLKNGNSRIEPIQIYTLTWVVFLISIAYLTIANRRLDLVRLCPDHLKAIVNQVDQIILYFFGDLDIQCNRRLRSKTDSQANKYSNNQNFHYFSKLGYGQLS